MATATFRYVYKAYIISTQIHHLFYCLLCIPLIMGCSTGFSRFLSSSGSKWETRIAVLTSLINSVHSGHWGHFRAGKCWEYVLIKLKIPTLPYSGWEVCWVIASIYQIFSTFSDDYPTMNMRVIVDISLRGICLVYFPENLWYSDTFSTWDFHQNIG